MGNGSHWESLRGDEQGEGKRKKMGSENKGEDWRCSHQVYPSYVSWVVCYKQLHTRSYHWQCWDANRSCENFERNRHVFGEERACHGKGDSKQSCDNFKRNMHGEVDYLERGNNVRPRLPRNESRKEDDDDDSSKFLWKKKAPRWRHWPTCPGRWLGRRKVHIAPRSLHLYV